MAAGREAVRRDGWGWGGHWMVRTAHAGEVVVAVAPMQGDTARARPSVAGLAGVCAFAIGNAPYCILASPYTHTSMSGNYCLASPYMPWYGTLKYEYM